MDGRGDEGLGEGHHRRTQNTAHARGLRTCAPLPHPRQRAGSHASLRLGGSDGVREAGRQSPRRVRSKAVAGSGWDGRLSTQISGGSMRLSLREGEGRRREGALAGCPPLRRAGRQQCAACAVACVAAVHDLGFCRTAWRRGVVARAADARVRGRAARRCLNSGGGMPRRRPWSPQATQTHAQPFHPWPLAMRLAAAPLLPSPPQPAASDAALDADSEVLATHAPSWAAMCATVGESRGSGHKLALWMWVLRVCAVGSLGPRGCPEPTPGLRAATEWGSWRWCGAEADGRPRISRAAVDSKLRGVTRRGCCAVGEAASAGAWDSAVDGRGFVDAHGTAFSVVLGAAGRRVDFAWTVTAPAQIAGKTQPPIAAPYGAATCLRRELGSHARHMRPGRDPCLLPPSAPPAAAACGTVGSAVAYSSEGARAGRARPSANQSMPPSS
eukprot:162858-Chlamydomonas_euryale.AAC.4